MTLERSLQDSENLQPSNAHPAFTKELTRLFSGIAVFIRQACRLVTGGE